MTGNETPDEKTPPTSLSVFDGLGGIDDARKVHTKEKTNLEKLLELEQLFMDYYINGMDEIGAKVKLEKPEYKISKKLKDVFIFEKLFPEFEKRFVDILFDETDLVNYVITRYNDSDHPHNELKARGLYSGFLLDLLTRRYEADGRKAIIHIDGKGNQFDFLFYSVRKVHELYLENLTGYDICEYPDSGANIDIIVMKNVVSLPSCIAPITSFIYTVK